jgi:periplasmic protein CpxP/Spy
MGSALMSAQGSRMGPGGPGMGPRFGEHHPPMERAFGSDGMHSQFWNNPRIVTQLKLTDDQRKAMDGILQQHKMTLIDLHANLDKAEVAMEPLMKADQPNENAILAQIDKVAQARAELEKGNARFLLAIRGQLTADQWKQMRAMRENHGSEDGQRGRWGGRPDGQSHGHQPGAPPAGGAPAGGPPPPGGPGDAQ